MAAILLYETLLNITPSKENHFWNGEKSTNQERTNPFITRKSIPYQTLRIIGN